MDYETIALIPAYNPDWKIKTLVEELKENEFTIVVVNDGSLKKCDEIFKSIKKSCHIIDHEVNKGKGAAIKTGLSYIKEKYDKYIVVTVDCDGQHKVADALKLCEYSKKHPNCLVLGSRRFDKDVPLKSKMGNTITRKIYQLATKTDVYDTQTGLRSFTDRLTDMMLEIKGERFEYEMNVLLDATTKNIRIKEIFIETIYINNNETSHFSPFKDSYLIYKELSKFLLSSFISFIIDFLYYTLFVIVFGHLLYGIQMANILARVISSAFNYSVNSRYVFNKERNFKSATSYFGLVLIILLLNTFVLTYIINVLHFNAFAAKVATEIILFFFSFFIQHLIIFNHKEEEKDHDL